MRKTNTFRMGKSLFTMLGLALLCAACGTSGSKPDYSLLPVSTGKRYGYINAEGEYVINPQFKEATLFRDGVALVKNQSDNYGYIDKEGTYQINPTYKDATVFSEGIAWTVAPEGYPVGIDRDGDTVVEAKEAERVYRFSDGMALFVQKASDGSNLYGFLDKNGKVAIPAIYNTASHFCKGLAPVCKQGGLYGYINKKGEVVIDFQFKDAFPFNENGQAIIYTENGQGAIDTKGNIVIAPQFYQMLPDGDTYLVRLTPRGDYGICDLNGKYLVNPQFEALGYSQGSNLGGFLLNGKYGYIDREGKISIEAQFDFALPFHDNRAIIKKESKYGLVDTEGKLVVNPQFDDVASDLWFNDVYSCVTSDYIDIDKTIESIRKLLADNKIDGMAYPITVKTALDKYQLNEQEVPVYDDWNVSGWQLSNNVYATLCLDGFFYIEKSDGWWGKVSELDKTAKADHVKLSVVVQKKSPERTEALVEALRKAFANGCGGFKLKIEQTDLYELALTITQ